MSTHREHSGSAVDAEKPLAMSPSPGSQQALSEGPPTVLVMAHGDLSRARGSPKTLNRSDVWAWKSPRPAFHREVGLHETKGNAIASDRRLRSVSGAGAFGRAFGPLMLRIGPKV